MGVSDRVKALAAFVPELAEATGFGTWSTPTRSEVDILGQDGSTWKVVATTLPFVEYTDLVTRLTRMAGATGWMDSSFKWQDWLGTEEGRQLEHPEFLSPLDEAHISRILTAVIRADRFTEGTLLHFFENGTFLKLAQAAERLSQAGAPE
jgi:hypothetical protein